MSTTSTVTCDVCGKPCPEKYFEVSVYHKKGEHLYTDRHKLDLCSLVCRSEGIRRLWRLPVDESIVREAMSEQQRALLTEYEERAKKAEAAEREAEGKIIAAEMRAADAEARAHQAEVLTRSDLLAMLREAIHGPELPPFHGWRARAEAAPVRLDEPPLPVPRPSHRAVVVYGGPGAYAAVEKAIQQARYRWVKHIVEDEARVFPDAELVLVGVGPLGCNALAAQCSTSMFNVRAVIAISPTAVNNEPKPTYHEPCSVPDCDHEERPWQDLGRLEPLRHVAFLAINASAVLPVTGIGTCSRCGVNGPGPGHDCPKDVRFVVTAPAQRYRPDLDDDDDLASIDVIRVLAGWEPQEYPGVPPFTPKTKGLLTALTYETTDEHEQNALRDALAKVFA